MTLRYDLFWSCRSPYSYYLLVPRLIAFERDYEPAYSQMPRCPEDSH
jgi:hypothetical protein